MVFLRDGVLRAEYHGRNGDNVRELDVNVGVVFDNGEWREVGRSFEQYNQSYFMCHKSVYIISRELLIGEGGETARPPDRHRGPPQVGVHGGAEAAQRRAPLHHRRLASPRGQQGQARERDTVICQSNLT